jgi:type I restriction enzyme S subunit
MSENKWFRELPVDWKAQRLKTVATYCVSNVDKVPSDDEFPVRLCNYTDVYHNDYISADMNLMETTATFGEIKKFGLAVHDIVITKDSEDWRDIAVPAMVIDTAPDLVCGYHLAIIRPTASKLFAPFLLRLLQSSAVNQQFQIAASGVTRYGLPKDSVKNNFPIV